jgi:hypothetical protein
VAGSTDVTPWSSLDSDRAMTSAPSIPYGDASGAELRPFLHHEPENVGRSSAEGDAKRRSRAFASRPEMPERRTHQCCREREHPVERHSVLDTLPAGSYEPRGRRREPESAQAEYKDKARTFDAEPPHTRCPLPVT